MGAGLCCAQRGATEDAVVDGGRVGGTSREANYFSDGDGSEGYLYEDEDGADIFFSAKESLSRKVTSEIPYPPTATRKVGQSSNVTVEHPESLLQSSESLPRQQQLIANDKANDKVNDDDNDDDDTDAMDKIDENQSPANSSCLKRTTEILTERLSEDLVIEKGYPGELSKDELDACLEFRRRLEEHIEPTYRTLVYLNVDMDMDMDIGDNSNVDFNNGRKDNTNGAQRIRPASNIAGRGPEEEAFALCRFLRARQFDIDKTFAMMDEHLDLFKEALTKNNLHRSKTLVEEHTGCPLPVFTKQFPMLDYGLAKNGAFVVYMKAGLIRLQDGFDCINTAGTPKSFVERYMPMAWYITCRAFCETMHRLQKERQSVSNDTDFVVLAEAVVVVDMEGLQRELFTKRTMEFIQQAFKVIECFPEILNRVVVINVPYFFTFIWAVLKRFIDARTARKIGFFSSLASAQQNILELVDSSQILSEYGGEKGNPTYEEALAMKLKRDGEYDRYIFVRYSKSRSKIPAGTNSLTLQTFALAESEEAELTVYTQANLDAKSESSTKFFLLPESSVTTPAANALDDFEKRTDDCNGNRNSSSTGLPSCFGQPAATTKEHSIVFGPGNFRIVVEKSKGGPVIEKAMLVISIR